MNDDSTLDALSVIPPRSRSEQLAQTLAARIRDKGLQPGDRVGTLEELHTEVGFARSTVSEAVRLLRERGVLEIRPGRSGGLFVAELTPVVRMRHTLLHSSASTASVQEAIQVREALEEPIALQAASACTERDAAHLRQLVGEMADAEDYASFMQRNWRLHESLAALAPNAMMAAIYTSCLGYISRSIASHEDAGSVDDYMRERTAVHAELVEAVVLDDHARIATAVERHNL